MYTHYHNVVARRKVYHEPFGGIGQEKGILRISCMIQTNCVNMDGYLPLRSDYNYILEYCICNIIKYNST